MLIKIDALQVDNALAELNLALKASFEHGDLVKTAMLDEGFEPTLETIEIQQILNAHIHQKYFELWLIFNQNATPSEESIWQIYLIL